MHNRPKCISRPNRASPRNSCPPVNIVETYISKAVASGPLQQVKVHIVRSRIWMNPNPANQSPNPVFVLKMQEVGVLAACRSPHIVRYYASVLPRGSAHLAIAMELMAASAADLVSFML